MTTTEELHGDVSNVQIATEPVHIVTGDSPLTSLEN